MNVELISTDERVALLICWANLTNKVPSVAAVIVPFIDTKAAVTSLFEHAVPSAVDLSCVITPPLVIMVSYTIALAVVVPEISTLTPPFNAEVVYKLASK